MSRAACTLRRGGAEVDVLPDRGALVSRLAVGVVDVLYLDAATLESPTGAVRGGIPLLFPFAGELQDGRLLATGTAMPRHGFGRRKAWQVIESAADSVSMRLRPDAETHAPFPIEWEATQTVSATPRGVALELHVQNRDRQPLPLAPGWHPYFPCAAAEKRACLRQVLPADALPSGEPVTCDVNVLAPADRRVDFRLPAVGTVSLTFSENLRTLEIWTPPDRDLLCVEPWVGPSNTINTSDRVTVPPGGSARFWMRIELGE